MSNSYKVSVYVPTHNRVDLLKRAVNSLLSQSYDNIEIVICDDGSTDDTYEYLKSIECEKVIVIRNLEPKGACYSRNLCIRASSGNFITGLDDDDYFDTHRVKRLLNKALELDKKNVPYSFIFGDLNIFTCKGIERRGVRSLVSEKDIFEKNYIGNQVFVRSEKILNVGLFDESLPAMQDYDLWIRLIEKYGDAYSIINSGYNLDISHAHERISKNPERLVSAFNILREKYSGMACFNEMKFKLNLYAYHFEGYKISLFDCFKYIPHKSFLRAIKIWHSKK